MSNYVLKKTLLTEEEQEFLIACFNRSMAGEKLSPEERAEQKRLVKLSEQDEFECLSTFWKCEISTSVE
jgi:hypothetical protein